MDEKICPLRLFAYELTSRIDEMPCIRERCAWWISVDTTRGALLPKGTTNQYGNTNQEIYGSNNCAITEIALDCLSKRALIPF